MSDMNDFVIENGVLKEYKGTGGDVVIPEGVTSIGKYAFEGCLSLTSVIIPESVTNIGFMAFDDCSNLKSINIPESVKNIGEFAFASCKSLTNVTIPEGVTSIGESAFQSCDSLTSVTIPGSVTSIGKNAFHSCDSLTNVTIHEGLKKLEKDAFSSCYKLTSVTIPKSVTSIGKWAFWSCKNLTGITIPESVTSIGEDAFEGCGPISISKDLAVRVLFSPEEMVRHCGSTDVTNEQIAYIYANRRGEKWRQWLREEITIAEPETVFEIIFRSLSANNKVGKTEALLMSEYIEKYNDALSNEAVRKMIMMLEEKKCPAVEDIKELPYVKRRLVDDPSEVKENPIEVYVRERISKLKVDPRIVAAIKKGIHYKLYKSRYIRRGFGTTVQSDWETGHYADCQFCGQRNFTKEFIDKSEGRECVSCHKSIP